MTMAIDYRKIEKEFMTSGETLSALAKKYKVATSPLYRYARKNEWEKKREKIGKERQEKAIAREISSQDDAWEAVKQQMRDVITQEWDKIKNDKHPNGSQVSALTRATKDARDMGVYGVTLNEKKMLKELEALERQLAEAQEDKDSGVIIKMEGCDDYAN